MAQECTDCLYNRWDYWFHRSSIPTSCFVAHASSALMDPMTRAFIASVEDFVHHHHIPLILFAKGQRKENVAFQYRQRFRGNEGILFVGKAPEKTPVFRTEKRKNPKTGWTRQGELEVNR